VYPLTITGNFVGVISTAAAPARKTGFAGCSVPQATAKLPSTATVQIDIRTFMVHSFRSDDHG
jgi:hypothetical protein